MSPYCRYREPFLPKFFADAASALQLSQRSRLLDLACGTGTVALGFAPYVGSLTGMDVDGEALEVARTEAAQKNIDIKLIHAAIEDFSYNGPPFDVVTIGRAHVYLPRAATVTRLERLVSAGGKVVLCGTMTDDRLSGPWAGKFRAIVRRWGRRRPALLNWNEFMDDSAFVIEKRLVLRLARSVSVEDLVLRALSYSQTEPMLGQMRDQYQEEIRSAITPYAVDGLLQETIETGGNIYGRRQ